MWDLLIPSTGPAQTVQGEVIRITGKVRDEIFRNGGGNWNKDFRKMLDALTRYFKMGNSFTQDQLAKTTLYAKGINSKEDGKPDKLCLLALNWVLLNPNPIALDEVNYVI